MGPDANPEEILREARTVAVVGASPDPGKPSHGVMEYLMAQGYEVFPVRPGGGEILGRPVHESVADIGRPVDLVDVFRRGDAAPGIAREAVAAGARALWLQPGASSDEAALIAREAGLAYVEDMCTRAVHRDRGVGRVG
jgi:hypothetical protein